MTKPTTPYLTDNAWTDEQLAILNSAIEQVGDWSNAQDIAAVAGLAQNVYHDGMIVADLVYRLRDAGY